MVAFAIGACASVDATDGVQGASPEVRGVPVHASYGAERHEGFDAFCERTLLVRRPALTSESDLESATRWFGGVVPLQDDAPVARSLPALLVAMHEGTVPEGPDAWPVARLLALSDRMGEEAFVEGLRAFVDEHRHGEAVGDGELLAALTAASPDVVPTFADAWLASDAFAVARVRDRFDSSRGRVLLRVDQLHAVTERAPEAFPFQLEVELVFEDGEPAQRHTVDVTLRRHLFELETEREPARVVVDPDRRLDGLVRFREDAP